jgi:hypothetical protein
MNTKPHRLLAIPCALLLCIGVTASAAAPLAEVRSTASPANDEQARINPPPLLWTLFGPGPLAISIDDQFDPPATNWRNKKTAGEANEYPNQWHATVKAKEKSPRMRVLAVLQIECPAAAPPRQPTADAQGRVSIGPWRIEAALDVARDASLLISRDDGRVALAADHAPISVDGKQYEVPPNGAVLVEADRNFVETRR